MVRRVQLRAVGGRVDLRRIARGVRLEVDLRRIARSVRLEVEGLTDTVQTRLVSEETRERKRSRQNKTKEERMTREERRQGHRRDAKEQYEQLPWKRDVPPGGMLTNPKTGKAVLLLEVPQNILDALTPLVTEHMRRDGHTDELTGEQKYRHVSRYCGRQDNKGHVIFRGWQVQRPMPGAGLVMLGRTYESMLGALIAAASYVDRRLSSHVCAHSWLLWLLEEGDAAADAWLAEVAEQLRNYQFLLPNRSAGGRCVSHASIARDTSLRESGYVHPVV